MAKYISKILGLMKSFSGRPSLDEEFSVTATLRKTPNGYDYSVRSSGNVPEGVVSDFEGRLEQLTKYLNRN